MAHSIGMSPDSIQVIDSKKKCGYPLYVIDDFKGWNFGLAFNEVPTRELARESIKQLYLCAVEMDFDREMNV